MRIEHYDKLAFLSDRLYVAWQALSHGDGQNVNHTAKISGVLYELWSDIDAILDRNNNKEDTNE